MLNWVVWNRTVFNIETVLTFNCVQQKLYVYLTKLFELELFD